MGVQKLLIILFISGFGVVNAQDTHMIPKEKWSKRFYISDEFAAARGLQPGEINGLIRVWNGNTKKNGIMRVVDIRWYFNSPDEAAQYLKLNMPSLSETGDPVNPDIKINDVTNLYIFNEGAGNRSLNNALGIKNYSYIFLFTLKNYAAKVYVSAEKKIPVSEGVEFAREAAKRLKAVLKK